MTPAFPYLVAGFIAGIAFLINSDSTRLLRKVDFYCPVIKQILLFFIFFQMVVLIVFLYLQVVDPTYQLNGLSNLSQFAYDMLHLLFNFTVAVGMNGFLRYQRTLYGSVNKEDCKK